MTTWWNEPIVMLDTETCGRPDKDPSWRAVEIACVVSVRGAVVFERQLLLDPEVPIPEAATKVHGITNEMVTGRPKFRDVAHHVLTRICSGVPAAYNAPFDQRILSDELIAAGLKLPPVGFIDPMVWISPLKGKLLKLADACASRGIVIDAHQALGDARGALQLLYDLRRVLPEDLGELLEMQEQRRAAQEADFQAWKARQPARQSA